MATIFIDGLRVDTVIGVHDWERGVRQRVVIDLEMDVDIGPAAASDDVAKTLDYATVARRVTAFVEAAEYRLVETLAERVSALVLEHFHISRVALRLNKPGALPDAAGVGVRIVRERVA